MPHRRRPNSPARWWTIVQVRVWRLDLDAVLTQLRSWATDLLQCNPAVQAVVLFGSLARGDATAHSDADVLEHPV
nr:nucleotidyltransferase domain-containing protein [Thermaerobacter sp. PB12/4term]